MAFPFIPLAVMAASAIGQHFSNRSAQRKQLQQSKELAQFTHDQNVDMWERQNAFNHPSQQMSRLQDAGLNPHLVYGGGSAAGNQAGQPPQMHTPDGPQISPFSIPQALSEYQNLQMQQAQIDNVKAQTANIHERTVNEQFLHWTREFDARTREFDLKRREALAPHQLDIVKSQADTSRLGVIKQIQAIKNMSQQEQESILRQTGMSRDNELKQQQIMFNQHREELRSMGIMDHDNVLLRILVRSINQFAPDMNRMDLRSLPLKRKR